MVAQKQLAQRSKVLQEQAAEEEKRLAADARAEEAQRKVAEAKKLQQEEKLRLKAEIAQRRKKFAAGKADEETKLELELAEKEKARAARVAAAQKNKEEEEEKMRAREKEKGKRMAEAKLVAQVALTRAFSASVCAVSAQRACTPLRKPSCIWQCQKAGSPLSVIFDRSSGKNGAKKTPYGLSSLRAQPESSEETKKRSSTAHSAQQ